MEALFPVLDAGTTWPRVLVQSGLYGYVLFVAANLIGDGAELLLLCPKWAPMVGSIVLPILGAVPDGMMVLFSGMGERSEAKDQVSVGMGAMAGSSVMLLTMPWFLAVVCGRVSLSENGKPMYTKPSGCKDPKWEKLKGGAFGLFTTGVNVGDAIRSNAKLMMCTCTTYLVIQIPAWIKDVCPAAAPLKKAMDAASKALADAGDAGEAAATAAYGTAKIGYVKETDACYDAQAAEETMWAYIAMGVCVLWFCFYLYKMSKAGCDDKITEAAVNGIKDGHVTIWGCLQSTVVHVCTAHESGHDHQLHAKLLADGRAEEFKRMKPILTPFFKEYDSDSSGTISEKEFMVLLRDLRVNQTIEQQQKIFRAADADRSGTVSLDEFVQAVLRLAAEMPPDATDIEANKVTRTPTAADDDDEEEDDMPEDLQDLSPEEQQKRIKSRAVYQMGMGTLLVLVFSDPMCDMLGVIGDKLAISKFFVSFLLAPLASNASELISAMKLASKKTSSSMSDALSCLEGAAVMNNTFCMAIFLFLVVFKNLAYQYKAETIAIITIECLVGCMALKSDVMRLFDAFIVLSCYPLCLVIVLVLQQVMGMD